jgi:hypothetical protein
VEVLRKAESRKQKTEMGDVKGEGGVRKVESRK